MRLLIDTQVFIWFVEDDAKLPKNIKQRIEHKDSTIILSIASLWEMTIKISLGKLQLSADIETMIANLYNNGFEVLPIAPNHLITLSTLDFHHRDPFDRLIIAQGLSEDISIVSSDAIFDKYNVKRMW